MDKAATALPQKAGSLWDDAKNFGLGAVGYVADTAKNIVVSVSLSAAFSVAWFAVWYAVTYVATDLTLPTFSGIDLFTNFGHILGTFTAFAAIATICKSATSNS